MAGDVVGTAFVRIKALTSKLSKEIEDGVKKGFKDAKLDKIADAEGAKSGEAFGDAAADSSKKTLGKRSDDFVARDEILGAFDRTFDDAEARFKEIDFDFDTGPIEASFDDIRRHHKRTADDIDNGSLSKSLDKLSKKFKSLGSDSGSGLGLLKNKMLLVGGAIAAALPYIQDVGAAVLAYATGLVAQIGFLVTALGGVGVAAGAALGATALAILPVVLAFKSETEFLTAFKDSIAATGEEFMRIGTATQQTLLPALEDAAFVLGDLIPMFSEFGLFVGRAVGDFATLTAETLTGNVAQGRFQAILQSSLRILDMLLPTLLNIGGILSGLWVAAIPASERFVGIISDLVSKWNDMVIEGLRTGELTNTFDTWFERARVLGSALGNLTGALFDILQVGADSSDNLFTRFDQWAERFRNFTESEVGQNKLKLIFDNALAVMHEVNGVVADLFDGIFGRLTEVGGVDSMVAALQRFRDVLPQIQEGWANMYDVIKGVVDVIGANVWEKLKQAFEELKEPLGRLADQLFDFLKVMNESGAFTVFLELVEALTNVLATLLAIPGFGTFIGYMLAFGAAAKVARIALVPFVAILGPLVSGLSTLVKIGKLTTVSAGLTGLAGAANKVAAAQTAKKIAELGPAAGTAAAKAGGLAPVVGKIANGLKFLGPYGIAASVGVAAVGAAFFIHKKRAQEWEQEIRQATEAIGLLNDGLNITATGVAKYIAESSRFDSRNQKDDLVNLGLTVESLGRQVAQGTISYQDFADKALKAGEVTARMTGGGGRAQGTGWLPEIESLDELAKRYRLTDEELTKLSKGQQVAVGRGRLMLGANDDLLKSFVELNKVVGVAAKESIDEFAINSQNVRLLGADVLVGISKDIKDASDEDAAELMVGVMDRLGDAATKDTASIKGLSDATRSLVREQVAGLVGPQRAVEENRLLREELTKQHRQIQDNLVLYTSDEFASGARNAIEGFVDLLNNADFASQLDLSDGLDAALERFPLLGDAALNLFDQLEQLPQDQFNAAATRMGVDADVLRGAMEGAMGAIKALQDQAIQSLPTVGSLLDDATSVEEDGTQVFNKKGFIDSVNERISDTKKFGENIALIKERVSEDAARLAVQEGPEAAANLAAIAGSNPEQLNTVLTKMEDAEDALKLQIKDVLGKGIAAEYLDQANIIGSNWGDGLASGLGSPATIEALKEAGINTLNVLENGFQGKFVWEGDKLKFIPTGTFPAITTTDKRFKALEMSVGGFVGATKYGTGLFTARGTDTVPAMLTPGEFVLRQSIASAIPAGILNSLNAGDPRLIGLLTSLSKNRPGSPAALAVSSSGTAPSQSSKSDMVIHQMNIEAPTPLEAARQVADRLRILQAQAVSG